MDTATTAAFNTPPRFSLRFPTDKEVRENAVGYMSPGSTAADILAAQNKASEDRTTQMNELVKAPLRPASFSRLTDTTTEWV
jgi:hypothetical protein